MKRGLKIRAILSFIFIALFYALSKLMKASLSPLVTIFINNNILSSAQIAALASIFYLVAGLMCIPAGMIVAKIGVKKSYIASALLLFFGTLLFAFSNSYFYFIFARIISAIGYSFVFACAVLVIYELLSEKYYAFLIGTLLFIGYMGAAVAGLPITAVIKYYNWHSVYIGLAIIQILFFIITVIILPITDNRSNSCQKPKISWLGIISVLKNRDTLISTAIVGCLISANFSIADVWGKAYLIEIYNYKKDIASLAGSSIIFIAAAFGGILLGYLESIRVINWNAIKWFSLLAIIAVSTFIYLPIYNYKLIICIGVLIGIAKSSTVLLYSYIKKYSLPEYLAVAIALTTAFEMFFSSIINFLIGAILRICRLFELSRVNSYEYAMIVIIIALIFNLFMVLRLKKAAVKG